MIFFDTNLLFYSLNLDCAEYEEARGFFASLPVAPGTVATCELVLIELYVPLRNPAVLKNPLCPADAVAMRQGRTAVDKTKSSTTSHEHSPPLPSG